MLHVNISTDLYFWLVCFTRIFVFFYLKPIKLGQCVLFQRFYMLDDNKSAHQTFTLRLLFSARVNKTNRTEQVIKRLACEWNQKKYSTNILICWIFLMRLLGMLCHSTKWNWFADWKWFFNFIGLFNLYLNQLISHQKNTISSNSPFDFDTFQFKSYCLSDLMWK